MQELIWIDVETTGLFEDKGSLLEVACILTDKDLNEQDRVETVIGYSKDTLVLDGMSDYVVKMHTENGLLDDVEKAYQIRRDLAQAEDTLINWILKTDPTNDVHRPRQVASSKPEFDKRWMAFHMPRFSRLTHYRTFDMNTLYAWYDKEKNKNEGKKHRAIHDLLRDIGYCREMLQQELIHRVTYERVMDVFQYINTRDNHIQETRDINSLLLGETVTDFARDPDYKTRRVGDATVEVK